jgi:cytochrome d ubiquinol oxidase subunit II
MVAIWYALLALMLTVYVVLDGFDLGAGLAHLFVARSDGERRTVLNTIGPVWDGNEVWLIASGGVLFFAFPTAYATAFSGFYLPLTLVLWLVIGRGLSIEFRGQWDNPLWRAFFDGLFALSSGLLAFVLGASLGNVVRGVPVGADGTFVGPLFSELGAEGRAGRAGALDGYTIAVGALAVAALWGHGAAWIAHKAEGDVQARARRLATWLWPATALLLAIVTAWTATLERSLLITFARRPWAWPLPLAALAGLGVAWWCTRRSRDRAAFFGSVAFLAGLMLATAAALFPLLLRSTVAEAFDVTAYGAATGRRGLMLGLTWWIPALLLAIGYFTYLFRSFAGKVRDLHHY